MENNQISIGTDDMLKDEELGMTSYLHEVLLELYMWDIKNDFSVQRCLCIIT